MSDESHSFLAGNLSKTLGNPPIPLLQAILQPACMKATPHAGTLQTPKEPLSSDPYINVHGLESMENVHLLIFASRIEMKNVLKVFFRVPDASTCTRRVPCLWDAPSLPFDDPPPHDPPPHAPPPHNRPPHDTPPPGSTRLPLPPPPQHPRGTTVLTVHHGHRPPPSLDNRGILEGLGPTWFRRG